MERQKIANELRTMEVCIRSFCPDWNTTVARLSSESQRFAVLLSLAKKNLTDPGQVLGFIS